MPSGLTWLSRLRRPWGNLPLALKGLAVVSIPVLGMFLCAALFVRGYRQDKQAEVWVTHTMDVRSSLDTTLGLLLEAESSLRGYLLTGDQTWLAPVVRGQRLLPAQVSGLVDLVSDNPIAAGRALELQRVMQQRLDVMAELSARERSRAVPRQLLDRSKALTDEIEADIATMRAGEDALLAERRAAVDVIERRTARAIGFFALIGIGAGLGGVLLFTLGVARRVRRAGQNAERLSRGETLKAAPNLDDEVGRLSRSLVDTGALLDRRMRDVQTAREELDSFFMLSLDLLCIASSNGRFLRVNPAWETTLGWTVEDLTTKPFIGFVHPDDVERTRAAIVEQMARDEPKLDFENRYLCKDGSYRLLHWKSVPLADKGVMYAVARDVTIDRARSRAHEEHAAQLAVLNKELEAFSYSVSHDLRAPLRSIDGFSQALIEDYGEKIDATGRDYLQRVRKATQRMGALIDDMLNLSRVARAEMDMRDVDLSDLARDIARELAAADPDRVVEWQIEEALPARGDARLLRIALENLINNAWKFTSKTVGARIEFGRDPASASRYVVRDNGAGFDMTYVHKLFGTFQRLHTDREFPGNGVGLATVQRIVRRHGGDVSATGAPGSGAAFTFTLGDDPASPSPVFPPLTEETECEHH